MGKCPFRHGAELRRGHAREMFLLSRASAAVCSLSLLALNGLTPLTAEGTGRKGCWSGWPRQKNPKNIRKRRFPYANLKGREGGIKGPFDQLHSIRHSLVPEFTMGKTAFEGEMTAVRNEDTTRKARQWRRRPSSRRPRRGAAHFWALKRGSHLPDSFQPPKV